MKDNLFFDIPAAYEEIANATKAISFNMASDLYTGSLLKTLVASKPSGYFLELGTGSGRSKKEAEQHAAEKALNKMKAKTE